MIVFLQLNIDFAPNYGEQAPNNAARPNPAQNRNNRQLQQVFQGTGVVIGGS